MKRHILMPVPSAVRIPDLILILDSIPYLLPDAVPDILQAFAHLLMHDPF